MMRVENGAEHPLSPPVLLSASGQTRFVAWTVWLTGVNVMMTMRRDQGG